jgi:hypothetical protein
MIINDLLEAIHAEMFDPIMVIRALVSKFMPPPPLLSSDVHETIVSLSTR